MTIQSERIDKSTMVLSLEGRLDTATAPQLERKLKQWGDDITEMILDFANLSYISSMGLRVLLQTHKTMGLEGRKLVIKNMSPSIREVFEMTGFINLMVQEEKFVVIKKEEAGRITLSLMGQMDSDNVPALAAELSGIREAGQAKGECTTVVLDVGKLSFLSAGACRLLKHAVEETGWEKRAFSVQNAAGKIAAVFEAEGMGNVLKLYDAPSPAPGIP
jgi:anti-sigma B factor antagonist